MKFLEKDLETIIYESGRDLLEAKGLPIYGKLKRQFKIGNFGIADLVEFQRPFYDGPNRQYFTPGRIIIYELKKEQIGISAFLQSINYYKGIYEYLKLKNKQHLYIIDIVLIGKEVDISGSFCYLSEVCCLLNGTDENGTIEFYKYNYTINGLEFNQCQKFNLTDKGF